MIPSAPRPGADRASRTRQLVYGCLALVGLAGTWYFNLSFMTAAGPGEQGYVAAWFANDASSSAAPATMGT